MKLEICCLSYLLSNEGGDNSDTYGICLLIRLYVLSHRRLLMPRTKEQNNLSTSKQLEGGILGFANGALILPLCTNLR